MRFWSNTSYHLQWLEVSLNLISCLKKRKFWSKLILTRKLSKIRKNIEVYCHSYCLWVRYVIADWELLKHCSLAIFFLLFCYLVLLDFITRFHSLRKRPSCLGRSRSWLVACSCIDACLYQLWFTPCSWYNKATAVHGVTFVCVSLSLQCICLPEKKNTVIWNIT